MAIYRNIQLSFWTDNKILDDFTPEDKYFYLYLLTNPHTNLCGCYEISYKSMMDDLGYNKDTILRLIDRFVNVHNVIRFNPDTKEILILNWYKYNWSKSDKTLAGVEKVASHVKCESFKKYIYTIINGFRDGNFTISLNDCNPTQSVENKVNKDIDIIKNVIAYLNLKCGTKYKYTTQDSQRHIRARLKEGYSMQNFCDVVDKKSKEWIGTEQEKYLRPSTLFGAKFESYLNQKITVAKENNVFDEWRGA
nr:MAG TPA: hypothetical protein [Bacteriophage sp.]